MATPLGHVLAGLAVYSMGGARRSRTRYTLVAATVFASVSPDLDVIPGLLVGQPALYHSGISHSLGMGVLVSLGVAGLCKLRSEAFFLALCLCFLSFSSHLLLDWLGPDKRPPLGIPVFSPVSGEYFISPRPLLMGMSHATSTFASTWQWLQGIFSLYNVGAVFLEAVVLAPFLLLGRWMNRRRRGAQSVVKIQGRKP